MPDMIPVATQIKPPDPNQGLSTLASIIGIRQAQQNLATGAIQQQGIAANVQQDQQKNRELQAAQQVAIYGAKSGQYDDGNGGLDRQKMANDILRVAPVYGQSQVSSLLSQANEVIANKQAHQNLTVSQKKEMGDTFASWAADPNIDNSKIINDIERLRLAHPNDPQYSRLLTSQIMHLPNGASQDQLRSIAARWAAAATGEPQTTAGTVDTGTQIQPVGINRFGTGVTPAGTPINKQQVVTTPAGSIATVTPSTGRVATLGGGTGTPQKSGAPRTAQDDAPPPNAPTAVQENFRAAAQAAREHIAQVREADNDYGTNVSLSNVIRKLSANTATGPGTDIWHHALGAMGAPFGANNVADYQLIGAYLDRQAALTRRQMGLPSTNEGSQTSQAIAGNAQYQQKALQDKNDLNQALAEGLHSYRKGLDKIEGFTGNPSPKAVQQFKSAWVDNFDPNIFRLEIAQKRIKEDPQAVQKVLSELSPSEAASLRQKRKNLQALEQGQLP